MDDLAGRAAPVTGASRGIGRAIAVALAAAGADIAVNYRSRADAAEEVCAQIRRLGRRTIKIAADVSRSAEARRLVVEAQAALGPIGILINNAGVAAPATVETLTEAIWDATLAHNLTSVFLVTQAALPAMRRLKWAVSSTYPRPRRRSAGSWARTTPRRRPGSTA
jgi:3-oxoacyl-[acyl-carrier protein] reductase